MSPSIVLAHALRSVVRAPVRSALTALGVIVGTSSIITTLGIGDGARLRIQEVLLRPESRIISLLAAPTAAPAHRNFAPLSASDRLTVRDYYSIKNTLSNVAAASPRLYVSAARIQVNGREEDVLLEGIDKGGFQADARRVLDGALFSEIEVKRGSSICVIGSALARAAFDTHSPIGKTVRINGTPFTVIGVIEDKTKNVEPGPQRSSDFHVYIPFTSLLRRIDPNVDLAISVQADEVLNVGIVRRGLEDLIEQNRRGRRSSFVTTTAFESLRTYSEGSLHVARLLAAVGVIALIVGGIGVMNIMLVSVAERTREIGVLMAIGTRSRGIRNQFLGEALVITMGGGVIGSSVGVIAASLITRWNQWPIHLGASSIALAVICSAGVGVAFGYQPAKTAARMQPAAALAH
jgi:putative ABC transport system permease protein